MHILTHSMRPASSARLLFFPSPPIEGRRVEGEGEEKRKSRKASTSHSVSIPTPTLLTPSLLHTTLLPSSTFT